MGTRGSQYIRPLGQNDTSGAYQGLKTSDSTGSARDGEALAKDNSNEAIRQRGKALSHLTASFLLLVLALLLFQFDLAAFKGILLDVLFRAQWTYFADPDVALINYDAASSQRYDGSARLPLPEIVKVLEAVKADGAKAVGILASINEKLYTTSELLQLSEYFAQSPHTLVGYIDDDSLGRPPPEPLREAIHYYPGYVSRDTFSFGADSVSRRAMITIDGYPSLYAELARLYHNSPTPLKFHHADSFGRLQDSLQTFINWQGPPGLYSIVPSYQVAEGQIQKGRFKDKVVLFADALTLPKANQFILTPYSRRPFETPLIEGAAQTLVTLLRNEGIVRSPFLVDLILGLLLGLVTVNGVLSSSPTRGILLMIGEVALLVTLGFICLYGFRVWLNLAHPLILICLGYYLVIPYRLLNEYRERWHYQEKSEFMYELELLKTNFLSLVSHDIKTPIARIQGNAELLLGNKNNLNNEQVKSLSAIVNTTDELGEYVQTILDFTRIESAQLPIQKTSKDVNEVIGEVIENKKFLAAEKNIVLKTELDPLFSIKFDVKLITRVLSNLVENAIKYSPPHTQITLTSKEENNWVRIAVADEGFGIAANDQSKVFGKFFRCQNTQTESAKGTGLGLYLVKYFVEMHRGMIDLRSELGKGSVFTVSLPV